MDGSRVLLVEPDKNQWASMGKAFVDVGCKFSASPDGLAACRSVADSDFDLVVADLSLSPISGLDLLMRIKSIRPNLPVVISSAVADVSDAVEAMKRGAQDFIVKPFTDEIVQHLVEKIRMDGSPPAPCKPCGRHAIITGNGKMTQLLDVASAVADSRASVFIQGESGTGKELLARHIHYQSNRRKGPFIAVNCAALPESLLESELFGHEKGAFTGAVARKKGKFELAHRGTLLLDEISEMDYGLQSKLLRALQEREIDRVGGTQTVSVDTRIIATTNREIEKRISEGTFREDLFYRLNVIPLNMPPLRERPDDIPLLSRHFIEKYNRIDGRNVKGLTEDAIETLLQMPWKGNVRELENVMERAVLMCDGDRIEQRDLHVNGACRPGEGELLPVMPLLTSGSLKAMEKKAIEHTLKQAKGNRTHAAKILGISVRTLRNKLNEYRQKLEAEA